MLLPAKHVSLAESLLGLGFWVLSRLTRPRTIEDLWDLWQADRDSELFPAYHSFENLILAVDFLFLIGAIKTLDGGEIIKCKEA